ncbi:MAG: 30S ribosomal protein S5 [Firmicutes bacterium]|nr:30S ribosomal protein S5 [Bacillota bacterium]
MSEELNENVQPAVETEVNNEIVKDEKKRRDDFKKDRRQDRRERKPREDSEFDKVLVSVRRVTKVVKGGRTMRFSAVVVVGDRKGNVGIGTGKAKEVPAAIDKATLQAKTNMVKINIVNGTIPHETIGKYGTSKVLMLPAKEGTGIIAGGSSRAVIELAGIKDIVTKIHGSTNKINCVRATLRGLSGIRTVEQVARLRGKNPEEI